MMSISNPQHTDPRCDLIDAINALSEARESARVALAKIENCADPDAPMQQAAANLLSRIDGMLRDVGRMHAQIERDIERDPVWEDERL